MRSTLTTGLVMLVALAGCQSGQTEGQKNIEDLTKSINKFADGLRKGRAEIETTIAEYNQVIHNEDGDLLGHFKKFNTGLDAIEKRAADIKKLNTELEAAAKPFFDQWKLDLDKFSSEDMKKRSMKRMEETKARFDELDKIGETAGNSYDALMARLRDSALFLANDLNKESASSLAKDDDKVKADSDALYGAMDKILAACDRYNQAVAMRVKPKPEEGCGSGETK